MDTAALLPQLVPLGLTVPTQPQSAQQPKPAQQPTPAQQPVWNFNFIEQWKNLVFASQHQECKTAAELLQKAVAIRYLHEGTLISYMLTELAKFANPLPSLAISGLIPSGLIPLRLPPVAPPVVVQPVIDQPTIGDFDFQTALHILSPIVSQVVNSVQHKVSRRVLSLPEPNPRDEIPVYFSSLSGVIEKLRTAGVDAILANDIAFARVSTRAANPFTILSEDSFVDDEKNMNFFKDVLIRLHDYNNFSHDGAPYSFDIKTFVRINEHLHKRIRDLSTVSPAYMAHEISITFSAMARFMAMHETSFDLQILFPSQPTDLFERAFHSALFWTYREAFKSFYYNTMPPPYPAKFELTMKEYKLLNRYWDGGNRHVSVTEAAMIAKRCPSLAPFQVYGFFDKKRRTIYKQYKGNTPRETIVFNIVEMTKAFLKEKKDGESMPVHCSPSCSSSMPLEREEFEMDEKMKLEALWGLGCRNPSINECVLLAADYDIDRDEEQIHAWFEDKRWNVQYMKRKREEEADRARNASEPPAKKQQSIPVHPKKRRRRSIMD